MIVSLLVIASDVELVGCGHMVEKCAIKCSEDLCLPEKEQVKFTSQNFNFTTGDSVQLWNHFKPLISEYTGDAENVYAVFYGML